MSWKVMFSLPVLTIVSAIAPCAYVTPSIWKAAKDVWRAFPDVALVFALFVAAVAGAFLYAACRWWMDHPND